MIDEQRRHRTGEFYTPLEVTHLDDDVRHCRKFFPNARAFQFDFLNDDDQNERLSQKLLPQIYALGFLRDEVIYFD